MSLLGIGPQKAPGLLDKATNILGNPLTQAALAGYLGFASSPRYRGFGGAVGSGGLDALQAFSTARQQQLQMPLLRAKTVSTLQDIPLKQAQIQGVEAKAGLEKAETGQYIAEPQLAQQMDTLSQNEKDPTMAMTYAILGHGLRNGMKAADAGKVLQSAAVNGSHVALNEANIQLSQLKQQTEAMRPGLIKAEQAKDVAQIGSAQASAARSYAGIPEEQATAALRSAQIPEAKASTALKQAQTLAEPGKAAAGQMGKINTDLARYFTTNAPGAFTDHDEAVARASAYAANLNPAVPPEQIKAAAEALAPPTGTGAKVMGAMGLGGPPGAPTAPPAMSADAAPAGATHEVVGPDGNVAGHMGADGKIVWLPGKEPRTSAER